MLGFEAISALPISGMFEGYYVWTRLNQSTGDWSAQSPVVTAWSTATPDVGSWTEQEPHIGTIRPIED